MKDISGRAFAERSALNPFGYAWLLGAGTSATAGNPRGRVRRSQLQFGLARRLAGRGIGQGAQCPASEVSYSAWHDGDDIGQRRAAVGSRECSVGCGGRDYFQGGKSVPKPLVVRRHMGRGPFDLLASEAMALAKMDWNNDALYDPFQ